VRITGYARKILIGSRCRLAENHAYGLSHRPYHSTEKITAHMLHTEQLKIMCSRFGSSVPKNAAIAPPIVENMMCSNTPSGGKFWFGSCLEGTVVEEEKENEEQSEKGNNEVKLDSVKREAS